MPRRIKIGDLVRSHYKAGWYGKVFNVEKRNGRNDLITVVTFCTADGRPHKRPLRKRLDEAWLDVVEAPPERYEGPLPEGLPDVGIKGGTPRKKFSDYVKKGQTVYVERYRHGWDVGYGTVVCFGETWCKVRLDDTGSEIEVRHVRDLTLY